MRGAAFARILDRYGQTVEITRETGETVRARALVQPVRERRAAVTPSPLGTGRRDCFLCLGEPGVPLSETDCVQWNGRSFFVENAQAVRAGEQVSHWRAVLAARDGEA